MSRRGVVWVAGVCAMLCAPAGAGAQGPLQRPIELGLDGQVSFGTGNPSYTSITLPVSVIRIGFQFSDRVSVEPILALDSFSSEGEHQTFYGLGAGNMVSVDVRTTPSFSLGASKVLFPASGYAAYAGHQQYAVSPDDKRFMMVRPFGGEQAPRLVLVKNWAADLKVKTATS